MLNDCYINSLAKIQVSAVFHSRVIPRSVSHKTKKKFIELCMGTIEFAKAKAITQSSFDLHGSLLELPFQ